MKHVRRRASREVRRNMARVQILGLGQQQDSRPLVTQLSRGQAAKGVHPGILRQTAMAHFFHAGVDMVTMRR